MGNATDQLCLKVATGLWRAVVSGPWGVQSPSLLAVWVWPTLRHLVAILQLGLPVCDGQFGVSACMCGREWALAVCLFPRGLPRPWGSAV